jgi:sporulation protein YhbH
MGTIFRDYTPTSQRSDRSARDRTRHRHKIKETLRDNIADILSEESIIGQDRGKIIKIPIRSVKEYRFIYGENSPGVAQGDGEQKPGDVVEKGKDEAGQGDGPGDKPGVDAIETDISLEELLAIMFDDLELPELEKKSLKKVLSDRAFKRKGYRKAGIRPRLDKKRTARNRIRRKLAAGRARKIDFDNEEVRFPFHKEDLTYHHVANDVREESNAVIFCIMDTSGSMGTVKKYLARSFYFLLYQFVRQKYQNVEVVFIAHHTEAKEVPEDEFFHKVESGGTYISSGYIKALEIIKERYHPSLWNVYAFHCSDGDNFYSDNERALKAATELCEVCNLFGYGEIKPSGSAYYSGSMLEVFDQLKFDNFQTVLIEKKEDLWPGFKSFLNRDKSGMLKQREQRQQAASEGAGSATP